MDTISSSIMPKWVLAAIIAGGLFYIAGQYVASQPQRDQKIIEANREITVQGTGEVNIRPDVAKVTLGVQTGAQVSAEAAMENLTNTFNAVVDAVRNEKVKEEDIRTVNFSLNPVYDYLEGERKLRGFEARELIEVKVRDLGNIGTILAKTTLEGVNRVGNVQFEVDDAQAAQLDAQKQAIEDAQEKADELAKTLGVKLGDVKSFSASSGNAVPIYARSEPAMEASGPEVPIGTNEISSTVTITYELK